MIIPSSFPFLRTNRCIWMAICFLLLNFTLKLEESNTFKEFTILPSTILYNCDNYLELRYYVLQSIMHQILIFHTVLLSTISRFYVCYPLSPLYILLLTTWKGGGN